MVVEVMGWYWAMATVAMESKAVTWVGVEEAEVGRAEAQVALIAVQVVWAWQDETPW